MATTEENIRILLQAVDQATPALRNVQNSIRAMDGQLNASVQAQRGAQNAMRSLAGSAGGIVGAVGGIGRAFTAVTAPIRGVVGGLVDMTARLVGTGVALGLGVQLIGGLGHAMESLAQATIGTNARLETATLQFELMSKSVTFAEEHVRSLYDFAKSSPFSVEPIIQASLILENFGGAALNTTDFLRKMADAAALSNKPIEEVTYWVARLFAALQSGRPFGESIEQLQRMGVLTGTLAGELSRLNEKTDFTATDAARSWEILQEALGRSEGAAKRLEGTWAGVTSTFSDSVNIILGRVAKPIFETLKNGLAEVNRVLDSPGIAEGAANMATVVQGALDRIRQILESGDIGTAAKNAATEMVDNIINHVRSSESAINQLGQQIGTAFAKGFEDHIKSVNWGQVVKDAIGALAVTLTPVITLNPQLIFGDPLKDPGIQAELERTQSRLFNSIAGLQEQNAPAQANNLGLPAAQLQALEQYAANRSAVERGIVESTVATGEEVISVAQATSQQEAAVLAAREQAARDATAQFRARTSSAGGADGGGSSQASLLSALRQARSFADRARDAVQGALGSIEAIGRKTGDAIIEASVAAERAIADLDRNLSREREIRFRTTTLDDALSAAEKSFRRIQEEESLQRSFQRDLAQAATPEDRARIQQAQAATQEDIIFRRQQEDSFEAFRRGLDAVRQRQARAIEDENAALQRQRILDERDARIAVIKETSQLEIAEVQFRLDQELAAIDEAWTQQVPEIMERTRGAIGNQLTAIGNDIRTIIGGAFNEVFTQIAAVNFGAGLNTPRAAGLTYGGEYATGGIVPGLTGMPTLITAHGGEAVIPAGASGIDMERLAQLIARAGRSDAIYVNDEVLGRVVDTRTTRQAISRISVSGR